MPFVDLFYVFLAIRILIEPARRQTIIPLAITAAFVMSFLADSPIGLFPLVLAVTCIVFSSAVTYLSAKGNTLLGLLLVFSATAILLEDFARVTLATSSVSLSPGTLQVALGTLLTILLVAFAYSFKRRI